MNMYLLDQSELRSLLTGCVRAAMADERRDTVDDRLTKNKAYEEFGRVWVDDKLARGLVTAVRMGPTRRSKVTISRAELLAVAEAERLDRAQRRYVADVALPMQEGLKKKASAVGRRKGVRDEQ